MICQIHGLLFIGWVIVSMWGNRITLKEKPEYLHSGYIFFLRQQQDGIFRL